MAHVQTPLIKPEVWGVRPDLVDPAFRWVWDGLVLGMPFASGGGPPMTFGRHGQRGVVSDYQFDWTGHRNGPNGEFTDGTSDRINVGTSTHIDDLRKYSVFSVVRPTGYPDSQVRMIYGVVNAAATEASYFCIRNDLGTNDGRLYMARSRATTACGILAADDPAETLPADVWSYAAGQLDVDGVDADQRGWIGEMERGELREISYANQQVGSGTVHSFSGIAKHVGNLPFFQTLSEWQGWIGMLLLWDWHPGEARFRQLAERPWGWYRRSRFGRARLRQFRALSLAADAGAYDVAGAAADLLYGRHLDAGVGSVALTGTAAILEYDRKLGADPGSYTIAGTATSLLHDRVVVADAGSVVITGSDSSLLHGRVVGAGAGSYLLTGSAASLIHDRTLGAGSGSYSITGTAAALLYARIIGADPGSYLVAGSPVDLRFGFHLAADGGSYVLTGTAANLLADRTLSADAGAYSVSGSTVLLIYGRSPLSADPGTYVIVGSTAGLLRGLRVEAAAGSYAVTGAAADLLWDHVLGAGAGTVVITGSAATLTVLGAFLNVVGGAVTIVQTVAGTLTIIQTASGETTIVREVEGDATI